MFDVLLHGASEGSVRSRITRALERTRFRILPLRDPPPGAMQALRVDVAVDCPDNPPAAARGAATLNAELEGPPPVVSVAADESATAARAGGASEVLPPEVDEVTLSSHIVRLAADRGRQRRRLVLQGSLDDLGLDALFDAIARRGNEARVVLRNREHQATVLTDGRRVLYLRVDGEVGNERALDRVRGWVDVHFELWVRPGPGTAAAPDVTLYELANPQRPRPPAPSLSPGSAPSVAPASAPSVAPASAPSVAPASAPSLPPAPSAPPASASSAPPSSRSPSPRGPSPAPPAPSAEASSGAQAAEVALACAVMNAATAFALASLPPARVASALAGSLGEASVRHPGLAGFVISREGRVTVGSITRAAGGLPDGLSLWLRLFLSDCERAAPGRFAPVSLDDILGGLLNMVRHAGWHEALRAGRRPL
ncbi:MAG TPA: hypothetical protein VFS43_43325 [Polyangiaceae bacterium]|nr:hypothetical protein [Polyangiaceae bacterium]